MKIIDQYDALLFDAQLTLLFEVDRFDEGEDFFATYSAKGGRRLSPEEVERFIRDCLDFLLPRYKDPAFFDAFPSLWETFEACRPGWELPTEEWRILHHTFAEHERGFMPPDVVETLGLLAKTHRLGLVSNIWAEKAAWEEEFKRKGVMELFETLTFSSDYASIKPSPVLFHKALAAMNPAPERALFIGDNPAYDVAGAHAAGMHAALVTNGISFDPKQVDIFKPEYILDGVCSLPEAKMPLNADG